MKMYTSITDPEVVQLVKNGAVGVLPGDTVYGLMGTAKSPETVAKIFTIKHREHKPGTVIAASVDQLVELGLKRRYLVPVEQYWPGAVSVVIPAGDDLEYLHQGLHGLAVRVPEGDELQDLLRQSGPLMTTSANLANEPSATTIEQAQKYFGDTVDFYVDGGDLSDRLPSTIVRVVDDAIEVIRQGAVVITD
jgi:L-threonylcarbamoyladenylate synthase